MSWAKELLHELRRPLTIVGCLFVAFLLAVMLLSAALGMWPPFMAVESKSMQHSDDSSQLGVIDTGDIVVASRSVGPEDVMTYVGSMADGYRSYGAYGDVVIFQPPYEDIPIVHRAICKLIYDGAGGFDIPELSGAPPDSWSVPDGEKRWWGLNESVELYRVGYSEVTVRIDLDTLLLSMGSAPHDGLITMGDNNWIAQGDDRYGLIDQGSLVEGPLPWEWVIGKVAGEVPWMGTLRLWLTGTAPDYLPQNTIAWLALTIGATVVLPMALWATAMSMDGRRERRRKES